MTQVRLWQVVSRTPNSLIFADASGTLTNLPAGSKDQLLVINDNGIPEWVDNAALTAALQASAEAAEAVRTAGAYTDAQIAALTDNAPLALNTLRELAEKLKDEDSAIVALLAQVDTKAGKAEVDSLITQAKQDSLTASKAYTDSTATALQSAVTAQVTQSAADTLAQAAQAATAYTDQSVAALSNAIPDRFGVMSPSVACFLAIVPGGIAGHGQPEGAPSEGSGESGSGKSSLTAITRNFIEITGAGVDAADPSVTPKLLLVNGVASSEEWQAVSRDGKLELRIPSALANHILVEQSTSLMLLAEYERYTPVIKAEAAAA